MTHNRGPNGNQALDTGPTPAHPRPCEPFAAALDHATPDGEAIFAEFLLLHATMVVLKIACFTAEVIRDRRALLGHFEQLGGDLVYVTFKQRCFLSLETLVSGGGAFTLEQTGRVGRVLWRDTSGL